MSEAYQALEKVFEKWCETYYALDVLQARKWVAEGDDLDEIVDEITRLRLDQKSLLEDSDVFNLIHQAKRETLAPSQAANLREMTRWAAHSAAPSSETIVSLEEAMKSSEGRWLESFNYAQEHGNKAAWENIVKPELRHIFGMRRQYAIEISKVMGCKSSEVTLDEWNPHMRNSDIEVIANEARTDGGFKKMFDAVHAYYDSKPKPLPVHFDPEIFTDEAVLGFVDKMKDAFLDAMELPPEERAKIRIQTGLLENAYCWGSPQDIRVAVQQQNVQTFMETLANINHELGHMTYLIETGRASDLTGQPVGLLNGYGTHEVAAMYFDQLSHKRAFYDVAGPMIREHFGVSGPEWSDDNLHALMTRPNFDNLEWGSSELTLFPNILWRVEAEKAIMDAETDEAFNTAVDSLPQRWAGVMTELTGVEHDPDDFSLDASHWFDRQTGYFWAYVFGGQVASSLHNQLDTSLKSAFSGAEKLPTNMADFLTPHVRMMRENIYQWRSLLKPQDLAVQATGGVPTLAQYIRYRYHQAFDVPNNPALVLASTADPTIDSSQDGPGIEV